MAKALRIDRGLERGASFEFEVDGASVQAFGGETVAAALMVSGRRALRVTARRGESRGYYCGMGVCWECMMWLEGEGSVQSCRVLAAPGMRLRSMRGAAPEPVSAARGGAGDSPADDGMG